MFRPSQNFLSKQINTTYFQCFYIRELDFFTKHKNEIQIMKKLLLTAFTFTLLNAATAQVQGGDFENWKTDTSKLDLSALLPGFPPDTFDFQDPIDWTSVNYITGADTFTPNVPGGVVMVTQTDTAHGGTYAARIETKAITIPVLGLPATIPGFVISGEFAIDITNLTSGGGFSPTSLPGSGIPVAGRVDSFFVWANYTPSVGDSALLLAVLRSGTNPVAMAAGFIRSATSGYQRFAIPFTYTSCDMPDSITFALSSSNLFQLQNTDDLLSGTLQPGSVLMVDDVDFSLAPGNYVVNPIANEDDTSTTKNVALTVNVLANDVDCDGAATLSLGTISTTTAHGTATKSGSNITYTPDNNYVGLDTVFYELVSTTGKTGQGLLIINVKDVPSSIKDVNLVGVKAFPNPTSGTLNIAAAIENASVNVFDLAGRVVATANNFNKNVALDITALSNGTYFINLMNEQGAIVGKTKFAVAK